MSGMKMLSVALLMVLTALGLSALTTRPGPPSEQIQGPDDLRPLLEALGEGQFEAAHRWMVSGLQEKWPLQRFAEDMGRVRDRIRSRWSPVSEDFGAKQTSLGTGYKASYRLAGGEKDPCLLELRLLQTGGGYRVAQWEQILPLGSQTRTDAARRIGERFVAHLQSGEDDQARALLREDTAEEMSSEELDRLRMGMAQVGTFEMRPGVTSKLINGTWTVRVLAGPQQNPASYLEMLVTDLESEPQIAAVRLSVSRD